IASYGALQDEQGARSFEISVVRVTPKGVVARIAGVENRTAAEALRGTKLYIERDRLPPTEEEEEFYRSDLIGLTAFNPEGVRLGEVIAVHNFGAGDILEVRIETTRTTEMVPFTRAFVPEVDLSAGRIVIAMPVERGEEPQET